MKLDKASTRLELTKGATDQILFDSELPGFGLRLRRSGEDRTLRSWIVQYRSRGRTRRIRIGGAEKVGADEARKAARKILAKVELGADPQAEKATARLKTAHTFQAVVGDFLRVQEQKLRPASLRVQRLYLLGRYFAPLHNVPIAEITLADVAARLTAITNNNSSITAGRARSALQTMYKWAMGQGLLGPDPRNPVIGTNKPQDATPRERVLSDAEIAAIWHGCGNDDDYGRIVKLLTLSACRRQEVGGMRWSELNDDNSVLSLPKERTKNHRAHVLPLTPLARSIIEATPHRGDRDHLFGERSDSGFNDWAKGKRQIDARLAGKVKGEWRLHDLRRSAATGMADLGVLPHTIEAALNHYSGHRAGVAGIYNRSSYEREVRAALAMWSDHVEALVDSGERKILPMVHRPSA